MKGWDFFNTTKPAMEYNGTYGDSVFVNSSINFLQRHARNNAQARAENQPEAPFFLYHAFQK